MPENTPELLKATQILEMDLAIEPVGGPVQTGGTSKSQEDGWDLPGFVTSSGRGVIGRGAPGVGGIPLGRTYSHTLEDILETESWSAQAFLARVVAEAIDADNPLAGKGLPEMAEVGEGILIYMLNRFAAYDEFLADPLLWTEEAPRYKLAPFPGPMITTPGPEDPETGEATSTETPGLALSDEEIQKNRKSTYLYRFIECVFDDIKNNPHVFEAGVTPTGEVAQDMVMEKDFLSCADIQPVCLACIQSVLDLRGWDEAEFNKNQADPVEGYKSKQGTRGDQSPCDGKGNDIPEDADKATYFHLLIQPAGEAIQKVIESLGGPENTSDMPQPCLPPPPGDGSSPCSPLQPYLSNHLNSDAADKLGAEGLLERYFQECLCPALKLGYFIMPLPPLAIGGTFHVTLPLATEAWFASLSEDDIPGEHTPAMGGGGVTPPIVPASQPKPASAAEGFDPNTLENLKETYKELATALGKDLDRDVVPALEDGSIKLLSLSVPSPIIPWAEITELEVMTAGGATELGAHFAHAVLEWSVDQIHIVDLRILGLPVAVGPPPYVGLMGSIPPPELPPPIQPVKNDGRLGSGATK